MSVLWYLPNLIGYTRIAFTLIAAIVIFKCPPLGLVLGVTSQVFDALDGVLARRLSQCSVFGTILDYTTDRMFVACWMIILTVFYPHLWLIFMLILSFDLVSHLFHMYSSLQQGKNSHKDDDKHHGYLLTIYYANPRFMFTVCLLHDLWISAMVMYHFYPNYYTFSLIIIFTPFVLFKAYIHLTQLLSASKSLVYMQHLNSMS